MMEVYAQKIRNWKHVMKKKISEYFIVCKYENKNRNFKCNKCGVCNINTKKMMYTLKSDEI